MCGIYGYIFIDDPTDHEKLHEFVGNLAIAAESRGSDAWGFSSFYKESPIVWDKLPYNAREALHISDKFAAMAKKMPSTFIGHTRATTSGNTLVNNNNHPFRGSRFDLVHNGSILDWQSKASKENLEIKSNTDSELYLRYLEANAPDAMSYEDIKLRINAMMRGIGGKFAIAMLDKLNGNLMLFRNVNPICVYTTTIFGGLAWFFASTPEIFNAAVRATVDISTLDFKLQSALLDSHQLHIMSSKELPANGNTKSNAIYFELDKKADYQSTWDYNNRSTTVEVHYVYSRYDFNTESFRYNQPLRTGDIIDGLTQFEMKTLEDISGKICQVLGNQDSTVTYALKSKAEEDAKLVTAPHNGTKQTMHDMTTPWPSAHDRDEWNEIFGCGGI